MRLFIFSCIQFLCLTLFSSGVVSQVTDEIHNRCKDVADYVGCITIFTGGQSSKESNEDRYANKLNEALRILSGRIDNTSLASFSSSIQPFTDAFSLARTDTKLADSDLVAGSEVLEVVLNGARQIWNHSINAKVHTMNIKNCRELNGLLDGINRSAGLMVVTYVSTAWFCSTEVRKEYELIIQAKSIAQRLANGEALDLKPYRSVSVTKEINDRQKEITKEIKTFEKQLKSAEKKLERAKKKSNKKPTEKSVALVEELTQETEGLAYKLNELRAEKRHFNTL